MGHESTSPSRQALEKPAFGSSVNKSQNFMTFHTSTCLVQGERVVSALAGGRAERAWALNALCLLSYKQDLRLSTAPGLLAALLPVSSHIDD